jgi:hypothetical protein
MSSAMRAFAVARSLRGRLPAQDAAVDEAISPITLRSENASQL